VVAHSPDLLNQKANAGRFTGGFFGAVFANGDIMNEGEMQNLSRVRKNATKLKRPD